MSEDTCEICGRTEEAAGELWWCGGGCGYYCDEHMPDTIHDVVKGYAEYEYCDECLEESDHICACCVH